NPRKKQGAQTEILSTFMKQRTYPQTATRVAEDNIKTHVRVVIDLWRLPKNSAPALDEIPKPYYCGTSNHTSAPSLLRRPCLALHPCALPVHPPPTTAKASALASLMSGVASRNVTPKRQITPVGNIPPVPPTRGAPAS